MNWVALGKILNGTFGTPEMKPLDEIITSCKGLIVSDNLYYKFSEESLRNESPAFLTMASKRMLCDGSFKLKLTKNDLSGGALIGSVKVYLSDELILDVVHEGTHEKDVFFKKGDVFEIEVSQSAPEVEIYAVEVNPNFWEEG